MAREPLATIDDVAEYFQVSRQTIYNWKSTKSDKAPEIVKRAIKVGGQLRFDWRHLDERGGAAA